MKNVTLIFLLNLFIVCSVDAQQAILSTNATAGTPPPPFTDPSSLSGLHAWYVASDQDADGNINEKFGFGLATWNDKSGNGYNLTRTGNPTVVNLNGLHVIEFNGSTDYYQGNTTSPWAFMHETECTIFWVGQVGLTADPNLLAGVISTGSAASADLGYGLWYEDRSSISNNDALRIFITQGSGNNRVVSDITASREQNVWTANTYTYVRVVTDPSFPTVADRADYWIDGIARNFVNSENRFAGSGNPVNPLTIMAMGNGTFLCPGRVAEVIIYNRKLTAQEVLDVEGYIQTKYGL